MIRNLHELCNIQYGYAFDSASFTDDASYTPLVRIRDVKRGYSETYYSGAYSDEYIIRAGDLLVGMDGEFNAAKWKSRDALLNQRVCKIIAKKETDGEYLRFALSVALKIIEERTAFVTVKHLSVKELNKIKIQAPSYEEQKNIAGILLRIEEIIQAKQDELRKLDSLIKARFVEMFGTREKWNDANWKITSIDEIIEKPKSGEWGQKDESGRGIGVIRTTNFSDRGAVYFNSITTRDIPREKLITKGIKNGDILIEKSGGSDKKPVGRVVLYTGESNKYLNNNFTAILRINNNTEVNNIFLFTFLYINYWQGGTKVFESKTTGIHNLNLKEFLNKTKIAIPDMLLQNQFATFVAQIDKSKFTLQNSIISLMNLWYNINQYVCERMYGEA